MFEVSRTLPKDVFPRMEHRGSVGGRAMTPGGSPRDIELVVVGPDVAMTGH